jgi:hypothetical protein
MSNKTEYIGVAVTGSAAQPDDPKPASTWLPKSIRIDADMQPAAVISELYKLFGNRWLREFFDEAKRRRKDEKRYG